VSPPLFFWLDIIALSASALIAAMLVLMAPGAGQKRALNRAFAVFALMGPLLLLYGDILVQSVAGEHTIFRVNLPIDPGWEDVV